MATVISHNIVSPLGLTSEDNYAALKQGRSALKRHDGRWELKDPFCASLFADGSFTSCFDTTRFELLVADSVKRALEQARIDIKSKRVAFILSTTKGNVELLADRNFPDETREYPAQAAEHVAALVGFASTPIVVCNACISGLSAIILGQRLIESGDYDYAVVCGADSQSKFIVSGFQSLKALSSESCRPFDKDRRGLNLGEAAATIVLGCDAAGDYMWHVVDGVVRNDSNHISGPSRTGEGSFRALRSVLKYCSADELAFVSVHGTATIYNDEMESIALERAGLSSVPVNALKGYYGHTMGAAGIMESIISMCAVDDRNILPSRGFHEKGVSGNITVNAHNTVTDKTSFIKLMSGFGGCNAAVLFDKKPYRSALGTPPVKTVVTHRVTVTQEKAVVDGQALPAEAVGKLFLTELYHSQVGDYAKFYKMDCLCKLGFIASELLLKAEGGGRFIDREDRAVILFNRSSSIVADRKHQAAISDAGNFFPSPSVFVYTLPNIITGEIAIRNKYYGETSLYILPEYSERTMSQVLSSAFLDGNMRSIISGWIDCPNEENFIATLFLMERVD